MVSEGGFFEDDEPVEDIIKLLEAGTMQLTNVAWDDEQEPLGDEGTCEFAAGAISFNPAPVVELCGKPGRARRGITWVEAYACDECYARWLASPRRGHARTRTHGEDEG